MRQAIFQPVGARARRVGEPPAPRLERGVLRRRRDFGGTECIRGGAVSCQVHGLQHVGCVDEHCVDSKRGTISCG